MKRLRRRIAGPAVLLCTACALIQSPAERAAALAEGAGFRTIPLPELPLRAYLRESAIAPGAARRLTIYIEGDGAPWLAATRPPADPTPVETVVLRMAAADPSSPVAYLGRPCQHVDAPHRVDCAPALWTHGRFGEAAVALENRAVEALKAASGASAIALVGYSGGGAMAALIAARRNDTSCLVSVAAPLDTVAWTTSIAVSPLRTSHNPAEVAASLRQIPQTHFSGGDDAIVPPATIAGYLSRVPAARRVVVPGFDHACCWADQWARLRALSCLAEG